MNSYVRYCFFAVIGVVLLSGCQESVQVAEPEAVGPNRIVVLDCIVDYQGRYLGADASRYVSEQVHEIGLDKRFLQITAAEPGGNFEVMLKDGDFTIAPRGAEINILFDKNIAKGLLELYLANVDLGYSFAAASEKPVKIEGQLYQIMTGEGALEFGKNLDTSIVEVVWLAGAGGEYLMIQGYNYRKLKTADGLIPTKIEVFSVGSDKQNRKLLIQYSGVVSQL